MSSANQLNRLSYLGYRFRCSESQHNSGFKKEEVYFFLTYLGLSSLGLVGRLYGVRHPSAFYLLCPPSLDQVASPTSARSNL